MKQGKTEILEGEPGDKKTEEPEVYELNWPGKRQAKEEALEEIVGKTLKVVPGEGKDEDTTQNLYIEGDNLEVLKLLRKDYESAIKLIYIDPPYNTGSDFLYKDSFGMHANWLNMIYPRLAAARELLREDGAIFISIDDNEVTNLIKVCDEIFGEEYHVASFPWRKRTAKSDVPFGVSQDYEQVICYAKSSQFRASIEGKKRKYYTTEDYPGRPWRIHDLTKQTTAGERPNSYFTIVNPKNGKEYPANPNATWRITAETFDTYYRAGRIVFPGDYDFLKISRPVLRYWEEDDRKKAGENFGRISVSTHLPGEVGMSKDGTKEITALFGAKVFHFPKPVSLMKYILSMINCRDAIVLDFFSGSASMAHAVMEKNAEDSGSRRFIMVQLPEKCDEKSEAYKMGYETICEVGKERIRRAGEQIGKKWPEVDVGFVVKKVEKEERLEDAE